jgi:hypothetical protein
MPWTVDLSLAPAVDNVHDHDHVHDGCGSSAACGLDRLLTGNDRPSRL